MWRQDGYKISAGEYASYAGASSTPPATANNQYGPEVVGVNKAAAPGIQVFPGFQPSNALI